MAASLPRDLFLVSRLSFRPSHRILAACPSQRSLFHSNSLKHATPLPIPVLGPAPTPPTPTPTPSEPEKDYLTPIHRKRQHAALLSRARAIRAPKPTSPDSATTTRPPPRNRFWTHTTVHSTPTHHEIHLDSRPVRTASKQILRVPLGKTHLAHAIALEWDVLTTAAQALRTHAVPLTAMVSRVMDMEAEERGGQRAQRSIRTTIQTTVMQYLNTDTLLCWAPEPESSPNHPPPAGETHVSLRALQVSLAHPILDFLRTTVVPGATFHTDFPTDSILPPAQPAETRSQIEDWLHTLGPWELVGLERAVLAGKSLLVGMRLVEEWRWYNPASKKTEGPNREGGGGFGIEEAANACSAEVGWQTRQWGEVEDTHDVDKEDLRRQFGSVVLVVAGEDGRGRGEGREGEGK